MVVGGELWKALATSLNSFVERLRKPLQRSLEPPKPQALNPKPEPLKPEP